MWSLILYIVQRFSRAGPRGRAREWATLGVHPLSWLLSNNRLEEVCGTLTKGTFSSRLLLSNQDKGCTPSVAHSLPLPLPSGFCSTCQKCAVRMCIYVVFCKIDHCIHIHWCIPMGLGHNDPWVESHMWPQQTWGQRSSRGQWPLLQVFGKKVTVSTYLMYFCGTWTQWSLGRVTHLTSTDLGSKVILGSVSLFLTFSSFWKISLYPHTLTYFQI